MSDESPDVPAPVDRRDAVRQKAELVKAEHSRARRMRIGIIAGVAVIVTAVVAGSVVWTIRSNAPKPMAAPANLEDGGILVGSVQGVPLSESGIPDLAASPSAAPSAPAPSPSASSRADIRIYVDYLAPGAKQFDAANHRQLTSWISRGAATVTYYPVAMLTAKSNGTKYSLRAAAAAGCVANTSPETFYVFHHTLLTQQPAMDADGMSDAELADLAIGVGGSAPKQLRSCIEDEDYVMWAKRATDDALAGISGTDGLTLTGTPMILVNGEPYRGALDDPKEFAQFVLTTASDAYYKDSAAPSPTATPGP